MPGMWSGPGIHFEGSVLEANIVCAKKDDTEEGNMIDKSIYGQNTIEIIVLASFRTIKLEKIK